MLDVGCGEGQYLFPYATAYPNRRFVGVDKNEQNIALCNSYIARKKLNNTTILHSSIESMPADAPYDLIICVGVLQYIADDQKAIEVMHDSLSDHGKFLLYVPVNNRGILSFYQQLMKSYPNYESVQDRKRIYTEEAVRSLLQQANFTIINRTATYGFFGILSNELFNSCTLLIVNAALPIRMLIALLSVFIYPFILLCMLLDFLLPIRSGNGLLLIAQKNS